MTSRKLLIINIDGDGDNDDDDDIGGDRLVLWKELYDFKKTVDY